MCCDASRTLSLVMCADAGALPKAKLTRANSPRLRQQLRLRFPALAARYSAAYRQSCARIARVREKGNRGSGYDSLNANVQLPGEKRGPGAIKGAFARPSLWNARGSRPRANWLRPLVLAVEVDADIKRMVVPVGVLVATPLPISFHAVERVAHRGAIVTMTSGFAVDPLFVRPQTIVAVPAPIMIRTRDAGYRHRHAQSKCTRQSIFQDSLGHVFPPFPLRMTSRERPFLRSDRRLSVLGGHCCRESPLATPANVSKHSKSLTCAYSLLGRALRLASLRSGLRANGLRCFDVPSI